MTNNEISQIPELPSTLSAFRGKPNWGLTKCAPKHNCVICKAIHADEALHAKARDIYCTGTPMWLMEEIFELPAKDWRTHIDRKKWSRKRRNNREFRKQNEPYEILLARYRDSKDQMTPQTADKMVELIVKATQTTPEVAVQTNVNVSWEDIVRGYRKHENNKE